MFKPMMWSIIFLSLSGIVWGYVAEASANPDIPAEHVGTVVLVGVVFTLGGLFQIANAFGLLDAGSKLRGSFRRQ